MGVDGWDGNGGMHGVWMGCEWGRVNWGLHYDLMEVRCLQLEEARLPPQHAEGGPLARPQRVLRVRPGQGQQRREECVSVGVNRVWMGCEWCEHMAWAACGQGRDRARTGCGEGVDSVAVG